MRGAGDRPGRPGLPVPYSAVARHFHWWTVALVAIVLPLGIAMVVRGHWLNIFDAVTNTMYDTHKLLGFVLFFVVAARLAYRIAYGPPPQDPTLAPWQVAASTVTHGAMYALLLSVPVLGWFGVQLYPALQIYGLFSLPAVVSPDNATAEVVLFIHRSIALVLGGLIGLHVAAALFHYFIRKDNVLSRMIPRLARRDRA